MRKLGHKHNYWYSQGAFRCKKCGHVTYGLPKKRNKIIILIPIIITIAVAGYLVYHNYTPQTIQSEANNVINNASNTIQQISSKVSQQSVSILHNSTMSLTNQDNRVPIAIYDNCHSTLRTDQKLIETTCNLPMPAYQKQFIFNMPDALEQALYNQVPLWVKTNVYQYGENDFKIGLYDQVGEKNYTVTLWQLP